MKTTKTLLIKILCVLCLFGTSQAQADIRLSFDRSGTNSSSVKVFLTDEKGNPIEGASATLSSSHAFMPTKASVTKGILAPAVNATEKQTVTLTFQIKGLPAAQKVKVLGLDLHAFNKNGGYQRNGGDAPRQYVITGKVGKTEADLKDFGLLDNIDIAANVGTEGDVHKMWKITNTETFTAKDDLLLEIRISTGTENKGCFIGLSEVLLTAEDSAQQPEEVCPFKLSPAVGQAEVCYAVTASSGKIVSMDKDGKLSLESNAHQENQHWYFVAAKTGYLMVNLEGHRVYSAGTDTENAWSVISNEKGFSLIPTATKEDPATVLTIDGVSEFHFSSVHNAFARTAQIYKIPCGVLGANYITKLDITGDIIKPMHFPLSVINEGVVTIPAAEKPVGEYTIYTHDQAIIPVGHDFVMTLQLNEAPVEGLEGFVHFDWDRDGIFEVCQSFAPTQTAVIKATVPVTAKCGKTRVRIRLTDNGMTDGDDDATGQIFDVLLNINEGAPESYGLSAVANDNNRGIVTVSNEAGWNIECEAKATPIGNSAFICWREGHHIVSLEANYKFTLNHETRLVGYFSPNTDDLTTGIEGPCSVTNRIIDITTHHKQITVVTDAQVRQVMVFRPDGQLVAHSAQKTLHLSQAPSGTYIVKVYTDIADDTAKILLK